MKTKNFIQELFLVFLSLPEGRNKKELEKIIQIINFGRATPKSILNHVI
jgi:hypothetical protein